MNLVLRLSFLRKRIKMEIIEFLQHTNLRNLKSNIGSMVKARLRRINDELNERRSVLRYNLECEHLMYSEELALLMKTRIEETARKREQWFRVHRMQREQEIEEFLKLKALQREMENCEASSHWQSKALLLDTKQAQLHQIKEKEAIRQKEKQIELMWEDVTRRYYEEKAKQDVIEGKLLKTIAGINQNINIRNDECQKKNNKLAEQTTREQFAKEGEVYTLMNESNLTRMRAHEEKNKEFMQQKALVAQIKEHSLQRWNHKKQEFEDDVKYINHNFSEILNNNQEEEKRKIQDSVWQECYINHVKEERERKREESKEFELMFTGTGCVLQQQNKSPYNKSAR